MPRTETIERTIYTFDELSDAAKERAREWYRGCIDSNDFDCEVAEFVTIGEALGIDFDTHEVTLMGGGKRREPNVYWSLGYCQSDHASFEGRYTYRPDAVAKLRAINDDETWAPLKIAMALAKIQCENAFGLKAVIKERHSIEVYDRRNRERGDLAIMDAEAKITELIRDLARYLYQQLRDQDEYLNSDEAVDENILANDYEFDEEGARI